MFKKSVVIGSMYGKEEFYDSFKSIAKAGYDAAEMWRWMDKDLERIIKLKEQYGIEITGISGDMSGEDGDPALIDITRADEYIELIKKSITAAKKLGSKYLHIHSNPVKYSDGSGFIDPIPHVSEKAKFASMLLTLKRLAPIVEEAGVVLVIEPTNTVVNAPNYFLNYTKDAAALIRLVGSPNIKVVYDVYHAQLMEGNLINTLRENMDVIDYVHFSDAPGKHEPGTGEINFKSVVNVLRELNYSGVIAFEAFPLKSVEDAYAAYKGIF